jgi:glycerol-3-phosphate O-acyltransferase / dihydroxyacetone phosphate acyltransferase
MLRLTAKSTQFGHRTFTSWLIESAGTVPIKRRKDFVEGTVDNSDAMEKLLEVCTLSH